MKNGYYRVVRKNGIWWLQNPEGKRMFYAAVQCVGPRNWSPVPESPVYDGLKACGSLAKWIERTEKRLKGWGFKGLGAWNDSLWHKTGMPFTESLNLWKSYGDGKSPNPVFSPEWERNMEERIKSQVLKLRRLPGLVGYFLDNEIRWLPGFMFSYFSLAAPDDPNRRAVVEFLRKRYRTIGGLNRAWGTRLRGFSSLARLRELPVSMDVARRDADDFLGIVAKRFFDVTSRLVRKYDPNRLILGVRYAGFPSLSVVKGQKGNTDVLSINLYLQEGILPEKKLYDAHLASGGQPVWITEFSFHSPYENRSGNRNTIGFGSRVRRQKSRGLGYEKLVSHAAKTPFVIGADWFQFADEPTLGRDDGEDVNFGLVDIRDRPYENLVAAVRRTNRRVDRLHAASGMWRYTPPPPFEPPSMAVGRLDRVPGAELSRFSDGAMMGGLKFRPSLDGHPARMPVEARVGWVPGGLWVSVNVSDKKRTVETTKLRKATEWFWMTDAVEIMLDGVEADSEFTRPSSLKVFVVPDGGGRKGTPFIGAQFDTKRVFGRKAGVRVSQKRYRAGYRVDFFVPAGLFQRTVLRVWEVLRFNLLVMDCEKVQEVCWSDHQGNWTADRPASWGRLILIP